MSTSVNALHCYPTGNSGRLSCPSGALTVAERLDEFTNEMTQLELGAKHSKTSAETYGMANQQSPPRRKPFQDADGVAAIADCQ